MLTEDMASIERFTNDAATYLERLGDDIEKMEKLYQGKDNLIQDTKSAYKTVMDYYENIKVYLKAGDKASALSVYMLDFGPTMTII